MGTRKKAHRERDLELISRLSTLGYTLDKMASHPDLQHVSRQTIWKDLKYILGEWRKETVLELDLKKKQSLRRLEHIMAESSEAWEKSKEDSIKKTIKEKDLGFGDGDSSTPIKEKSVSTENKHGNPAYLKEFREAVKEVNKLLGLHATEKKQVELSGEVKQVNEVDYSKFSEETLRLMQAELNENND